MKRTKNEAKPARRVPRKVWLLLICAAGAALVGLSTGTLGPRDARATFLDAAASDMAKDPRLTVVGVDHAAGQLTVLVKPIRQTFTLVVTEARELRGGQTGEQWKFEWKDHTGKVVSTGQAMSLGSTTKYVHVDVPGLQ